jgi:hypothetical protein
MALTKGGGGGGAERPPIALAPRPMQSAVCSRSRPPLAPGPGPAGLRPVRFSRAFLGSRESGVAGPPFRPLSPRAWVWCHRWASATQAVLPLAHGSAALAYFLSNFQLASIHKKAKRVAGSWGAGFNCIGNLGIKRTHNAHQRSTCSPRLLLPCSVH